MKLKYIGLPAAPVTFAGKFTVEPGDEIETEEPDTNILLQSGFFQAVEGDSTSADADKGSKKSSSTDDDDGSKGSKK